MDKWRDHATRKEATKKGSNKERKKERQKNKRKQERANTRTRKNRKERRRNTKDNDILCLELPTTGFEGSMFYGTMVFEQSESNPLNTL